MGDTGFSHNGISEIKFLNHFASLPGAANATNSNSIVEFVIQVCFFDAHGSTHWRTVLIIEPFKHFFNVMRLC